MTGPFRRARLEFGGFFGRKQFHVGGACQAQQIISASLRFELQDSLLLSVTVLFPHDSRRLVVTRV